MEELLKLVELVKQEAPQAKVKVDSFMVMHYFTMEELLNICNKYAEYKCALADVVGQSEQLLALAQYMCEHQNNLDGKTAKDYLQDFLSQ
jgi:hypothetical protein